MPSVLWCCWLGGRKGIWPVKNRVLESGMVICLERGADLHMAQLIPLPLTVSCFSKIQIGFTFLVPAYPGSPGQRAVKRVCVCVCLCLQLLNVYSFRVLTAIRGILLSLQHYSAVCKLQRCYPMVKILYIIIMKSSASGGLCLPDPWILLPRKKIPS